MKSVYYFENGGPEVLQYGDTPDPDMSSDTVLIRVEWVSIEGGDLLNRLLTPPRTTPFVPGYQAAGTVEAVGAEVRRIRPGDRVVGFNWSGSHAERFAVPDHYAYPVPAGLDLQRAAAIPIAFGTAHDALFEYGGLRAGEYVLIQGAAGGVGLAAVQLAARAGAVVIATASSSERLDRLRALGAHHGINYKTESIAERSKAITKGQGVDLAIDLAGGQGKDQLVEALRLHGRYAVVGAAEGTPPSFGFFELIRNALQVTGISFGRDMHTARVHQLLDTLMRRVAEGDLLMPIDRVFALSEAAKAHAHVATGHPFGRVLMRPEALTPG
jgi:NADPH2:quinone reductase